MTSNIPADEEPLDYLREVILRTDDELTEPHPHEITKEVLGKGVFDKLAPEDYPAILQALLNHWAADEVLSFMAAAIEYKHASLHRDCCMAQDTLERLDFDPDEVPEHPHDPFHHNPGSG
jgi:hypothetical protein